MFGSHSLDVKMFKMKKKSIQTWSAITQPIEDEPVWPTKQNEAEFGNLEDLTM